MKRIWTKNRMREIIDSGLKIFDKQNTCLSSSGNCVGGTQRCGYIRPSSEVECNGNIFPQGHLQRYDLDQWEVEGEVAIFIKEKAITKSVWWSNFFYRDGLEVKHNICSMVIAGDTLYVFTNKKNTKRMNNCVHFLVDYVLEEREEKSEFYTTTYIELGG